MKKQYFVTLSLMTLALASCENFFDEKQIGNNPAISDTRTKDYTLTADDYKAIASNAENKDMALAAAADSSVFFALKEVETRKAFNDIASADMFVPAFIRNKYPELDEGAVCNVTYQTYVGKAVSCRPFDAATNYTLTKEDYKVIWNGRGVQYLTDANVISGISAYLKATFPTATEGKVFVVNYNYSPVEPDTVKPLLGYECSVADLIEDQETKEHQLRGIVGTVKSPTYGRFYLVDHADSIYVSGLSDEDGNNKIWKDFGINGGDSIVVKGRFDLETSNFINAIYVSHKAANAPVQTRRKVAAAAQVATCAKAFQLVEGEWVEYTNDKYVAIVVVPAPIYEQTGSSSIADPELTIVKYLTSLYPYAPNDGEYLVVYKGASHMTADVFVVKDNVFTMVSEYETESMAFQLKPGAWKADISTYYKQTIVGEGMGKLVIVENNRPAELSYVWKYDAAYGMKGTTYASGAHAGEAWVVTPAIKMKKAIRPALQFDQAINYGPTDENRGVEMSVWVSTKFDGTTIRPEDWTKVEWNKFNAETNTGFPETNSWTFYNTGDMDLTPWAGQVIYIGWRYHAEEGWTCSTWEFKNVLVYETATEQ